MNPSRSKSFIEFLKKGDALFSNEWSVDNKTQEELSVILNRSIPYDYSSLGLAQVFGETIYTLRKNNFNYSEAYLFFEDRIISKIYDKDPESLIDYLDHFKKISPDVIKDGPMLIKNQDFIDVSEIEFNLTKLGNKKVQ